MTTILGLDLGKFKSVACLYDSTTTAARFATVHTDLAPRLLGSRIAGASEGEVVGAFHSSGLTLLGLRLRAARS